VCCAVEVPQDDAVQPSEHDGLVQDHLDQTAAPGSELLPFQHEDPPQGLGRADVETDLVAMA